MDIDVSQIKQSLVSAPAATQTKAAATQPANATSGADRSGTVSNTGNSSASANEKDKVNRGTADNKDNRKIENALNDVTQFMQSQFRELSFSVDKATNQSVVTVTDSDTGKVIRQIPSDEVLKMAARIKQLQSDIGASVGILFNKQA